MGHSGKTGWSSWGTAERLDGSRGAQRKDWVVVMGHSGKTGWSSWGTAERLGGRRGAQRKDWVVVVGDNVEDYCHLP